MCAARGVCPFIASDRQALGCLGHVRELAIRILVGPFEAFRGADTGANRGIARTDALTTSVAARTGGCMDLP